MPETISSFGVDFIRCFCYLLPDFFLVPFIPNDHVHTVQVMFIFINKPITLNGAAMYHIPTGKCLKRYRLSEKAAEMIMKATEEENVTYEAFIDGRAYAGNDFLKDPEDIDIVIRISKSCCLFPFQAEQFRKKSKARFLSGIFIGNLYEILNR